MLPPLWPTELPWVRQQVKQPPYQVERGAQSASADTVSQRRAWAEGVSGPASCLLPAL